MRQFVIMYPDGKYHTVSAHRFYGVLYQGNITYVLEYDDLTANVRNCFSILDREGNTFVKKPLADRAAYSLFAAAIRFSRKRSYNLNVLPGKIELCREALVELDSKDSLERQDQPIRSQSKKQFIVYKDIGSNHDSFPFYLDKDTALAMGFTCDDLFYHLDLNMLDTIKRDFDIVERVEYLNLGLSQSSSVESFADVLSGPKSSMQPLSDGDDVEEYYSSFSVTTNHSSFDVSYDPDNVIVYEDISLIREKHPFYINVYDALRFGLNANRSKTYYHLNEQELSIINRFGIVRNEKKELAILPQRSRHSNNPNGVLKLNPKEIKTLEDLFEGLMDFEDYYSFFGIEDLRNASFEQIFNSPRLIALTNLFKKGKECGNDLAIDLMEFLEGFRKELIYKNKKF